MSDDQLQKKAPEAVREKMQYVLAFGVIATMLFAVNFPPFIIVFFAIFAFFLWKVFASPPASGTREIFEFYLSANEILRDDERRWFGFEMQDVIRRGEQIVQLMNGAPPLVYFTLGALYNRAGNHQAAVQHLSFIVENENADERKYLYATPELKSYVKILRDIERESAKAPQTSAAVRALERTRRNRSKFLLEESRNAVKELESLKNRQIAAAKNSLQSEPVNLIENNFSNDRNGSVQNIAESFSQKSSQRNFRENTQSKKRKDGDEIKPRRSISEVLHDIYDK